MCVFHCLNLSASRVIFEFICLLQAITKWPICVDVALKINQTNYLEQYVRCCVIVNSCVVESSLKEIPVWCVLISVIVCYQVPVACSLAFKKGQDYSGSTFCGSKWVCRHCAQHIQEVSSLWLQHECQAVLGIAFFQNVVWGSLQNAAFCALYSYSRVGRRSRIMQHLFCHYVKYFQRLLHTRVRLDLLLCLLVNSALPPPRSV